jgi:hypothetical protein
MSSLRRIVTVLARCGDVRSEAVFREDQVIVSLVLLGFSTPVAKLWIYVDEDD